MALRYRDVAVKTAYRVLADTELSPVDLGNEFQDGTFLTNKQLDKVQGHYDKIVARLKKQVDKIKTREKAAPKKTKKTKKVKKDKPDKKAKKVKKDKPDKKAKKVKKDKKSSKTKTSAKSKKKKGKKKSKK